MNIPKLSVNRPITTIMIFTAIVLLGFISWGRLPQELFPSITYPQITVVTAYENAAPEEIESLITKSIEEAVGTVNNVKRISSISKEGLSLVMAEFNWGTNMDFAALNVREKIDLVKEKLPRESQEPIVMKYNPFDLPIMNLAVTGGLPPLELREICRKYIKDSIEKTEGVASATITGGDEREILVEIDQPRLRASQIPIVSVVDSLRAANINYPAGTIKESFYEYLIRTMGEYQKVTEIQETPTALDLPEEEAKTQEEKEKKEKQGRRLVYLKDIAKVEDTIKEKTSISRYNGKDSVSLVIRKQSGTNTLNVVKGVKKEIQKLLAEKLPQGIKIQVTYDQSQFIQEAISNVRDAAVQGAFLAFLVLFFFLWEFKSSGVITFSIPISIMATFCLMYFSNINLNMMSLGGLALGVGMLVDNSIVVIENIFRHRQMQKNPIQACIDGTQEMVGPIIGSTLTTVAVFLPFAFVLGVVGQIFKQLSLTITFSLIVSIIVALSLVPVLISLGRRRKSQSLALLQSLETALVDKTKLIQEKFQRLQSAYGKFIANMLHQKGKVIGIVLLLFFISMFVILFWTQRQFLPRVDQRQFIIKVELAPGTRLEITDSVVKKIEGSLLKLPETKDVTVNIGSSAERTSAETTSLQTLGSHQAQIMVNLKKKSRAFNTLRSTDEVIQYLKNKLEKQDLEGAEIEYVAQETSFGTALEQGAPIAVEIKGADLNKLIEISSSLQSKMSKISGVYGIKSNMPAPSPETKLHVLKDKASLYGLSVRDIAVTAQVALKGYVATKFKEKQGQEDVDIRVRLRPEDRSDLGNLRRLLIHSPLGMDVSLSDVAYLTKGKGPTEIKRVDQQRNIILTANTYGRNFNQIINEINKIIRSAGAKVSKDYSLELVGEQQRMKESFHSLAFAMALAFILVYMIMAGEFESLWQPFLIMFTIPLSLIGVAFALSITRTPLSSVAYLGIIMLGGIAVNNGIVLIDLVNVLRKQGYSAYDAVVEASKNRLRPILMTSLTTILGLLPLALGIGEGAELQAPLAITVMGGLTSATFLTLVFIPALYLMAHGYFETPPPLPEIKIAREEIKPEPEPIIPPPRPSLEIKLPAPAMPAVIKPIALPIPEEAVEPQAKIPLEKRELNVRQQELLIKLKEIKKITRKEYARMFKVSVPTAARDLKELADNGLIKARGPLGPGRWYELI
ncbi:MAG: efflux RND transporter permease subunit [Candidatus Omnitrophica bacterium]|nr:efflux RND transporter permease subunit [Candidatus Omnitrophota bacterium]MDD5592069.1 efflux RND transporter permease subunit [Candidatus Omnitrophota bacterium]